MAVFACPSHACTSFSIRHVVVPIRRPAPLLTTSAIARTADPVRRARRVRAGFRERRRDQLCETAASAGAWRWCRCACRAHRSGRREFFPSARRVAASPDERSTYSAAGPVASHSLSAKGRRRTGLRSALRSDAGAAAGAGAAARGRWADFGFDLDFAGGFRSSACHRRNAPVRRLLVQQKTAHQPRQSIRLVLESPSFQATRMPVRALRPSDISQSDWPRGRRPGREEDATVSGAQSYPITPARVNPSRVRGVGQFEIVGFRRDAHCRWIITAAITGAMAISAPHASGATSVIRQ